MAERGSLVDVGLVFVGGAAGTLLRASVAAGTGPVLGTVVVDVVGSLLLGLLVGLAPSRRLRLLLGVGALGGLTTYSTFAVETLGLGVTSGVASGLLAGLAHAASGVLAAALGLWLAGLVRRRRGAAAQVTP